MERKLKIGIIGAGNIGGALTRHLLGKQKAEEGLDRTRRRWD